MPSLEPLLENPKLEPELRNAIQENLIVLIQRREGGGSTEATITNNVNNGNSNENAHSGTTFPTANLPASPLGNKEPSEALHLNFSLNPATPTAIPSPDICSAAIQSFQAASNVTSTTTTTPITSSAIAVKGLASLVPQTNIKFEPSSITFMQDDPSFSDEDDDDGAESPVKPAGNLKLHTLMFMSVIIHHVTSISCDFSIGWCRTNKK